MVFFDGNESGHGLAVAFKDDRAFGQIQVIYRDGIRSLCFLREILLTISITFWKMNPIPAFHATRSTQYTLSKVYVALTLPSRRNYHDL